MINEIKNYDQSFLETNFLSNVDHIIMLLINGISDRNLSNVKHYLPSNIYNKFNDLINDYKNKKIIRKFDEANIKSSEILHYSINNDIINNKGKVITRYMDYFNDENGNYINGENQRRLENEKIIVVSKRLNNIEIDGIIRCKNCGHSLDISSSNICNYCKETFDMIDYSYIISEIDLF